MIDTIPYAILDTKLPATAPTRATEHAVGYDLTATHKVLIRPHARELVRTNIAIEIPEGYAGLVLPRSGLALKRGLAVLNAPGLIDPDYRGEVGVILHNTNDTTDILIADGERIAQLLILPVALPAFELVPDLSGTARAGGGFGSTGD